MVAYPCITILPGWLTGHMPYWLVLPCVLCCAVYESEEYYRATVQPQLEDGSSIPADVYIWKDQYRCALHLH
jgi:hypothetical protein